jgi:hypothetical protein
MATNVPERIELVARSLPECIRLEVPLDFPESIKLDASEIPERIQVVGIPETITLVHDLPDALLLKAPDDLEIPVAWKGAPASVDVNVKVDLQKVVGESESLNCVAIVPCPQN